MEHVDEETLTMMALGEHTTLPAVQHVHRCARCREELDALRAVVTVMRTTPPDERDLVAPPESVWRAIAGELGVPGPRAPDPGPTGERPVVPVTTGRGRSSPARRRGRFVVGLAACAALLGAAAGSTVTWWTLRPETRTEAAPGASLAPLRDNAAGYAGLGSEDGHRRLTVFVEGLPRTSGYFEVWLMDRTHTKLVSMGVLGPDGRATLPVPDTIDLSEYSVVDVSVQSYNGKPDHSGDSVVRGPYRT